jgi:hypothetical protein
MLADSVTRRVVAMDWSLPGGYGLDLDAIEEVLSRQSNAEAWLRQNSTNSSTGTTPVMPTAGGAVP